MSSTRRLLCSGFVRDTRSGCSRSTAGQAPTLLHARYEQRVSGRHPGHFDADRIADARVVLQADRYLLPLPDELVVVDTTSFDEAGYERVLEAVRAHLVA